MRGQIVHIELKSADFPRAARFYGDVFGWKTQDVPDMGYLLFSPPAGPAGGFTRPEAAQSPGVLAYLEVEDIDAALASIEKAGGRTILGKAPVGEMGSMAIFADPDGNTVGIWSTRPAAAAGVRADSVNRAPAADAKAKTGADAGAKAGATAGAKAGATAGATKDAKTRSAALARPRLPPAKGKGKVGAKPGPTKEKARPAAKGRPAKGARRR